MASSTHYVGIDFGTSKSAMAWYDPRTRRAEPLRNEEGEEATPSVVYFGETEAEDLVGTPALRMLEDPEQRRRVLLSVKREMGTPRRIPIGGRRVTRVEIAAKILRRLKEDAEALHFHEPVSRAVVTVPATFDTLEQDRVAEAARLAGFEEVELLPEPVAAALAYAEGGFDVGGHMLVYDLGAGTCDLAFLVREGEGNSFRLALPPEGDRHGGDDFDFALYEHLDEVARKELGRSLSPGSDLDLQFLLECRRRKENLSRAQRCQFSSLLHDPERGAIPFKHSLGRETFEALISPFVETSVRMARRYLDSARTRHSDVRSVVLIGGSSRVPLVHRMLGEALSCEPFRWQYQDLAVALGSAHHAHRLWGDDFLGPEKQDTRTRKRGGKGADEKALEGGTSAGAEAALLQYRAALTMAWVDKKLDPAELQFLTSLGAQLGLSPAQTHAVEKEVTGFFRTRLPTLGEEAPKPAGGETATSGGRGRGSRSAGGEKTSGAGASSRAKKAPAPGEDAALPAPSSTEIVVAATGGHCTTLGAALERAAAGATIRVRAGRYAESVTIVTDVEIIGDGVDRTVLDGRAAPAIRVRGGKVTLRGLALLSEGSAVPAVEVTGGHGVLEGCGLRSGGWVAAAVSGSQTRADLTGCTLRAPSATGAWFSGGAKGVLQGCTFAECGHSGIEIEKAASPTLLRCQIIGPSQVGVYLHAQGSVRMEGCEITQTGLSGMLVKEESRIQVLHCRIHACRQAGILISDRSSGSVEDCSIYGNAYSGVEVSHGGRPSLVRCKINNNLNYGLYVHTEGECQPQGCDLSGNKLGEESRQGGLSRHSPKGDRFAKLRQVLAAQDWTAADQESIRLVREASGHTCIDSEEKARAVPEDLLRALEQMWTASGGGPLKERQWVYLLEGGVTAFQAWYSWVTWLQWRLRQLGIG